MEEYPRVYERAAMTGIPAYTQTSSCDYVVRQGPDALQFVQNFAPFRVPLGFELRNERVDDSWFQTDD